MLGQRQRAPTRLVRSVPVRDGAHAARPPVSLGQYGARFAFQAAAWRSANVSTIELRTVVRQSGDAAFIDLLAPVRVGVCSHDTTAALAACHISVKPMPSDAILPTKLYCTNRNVDEENGAHLRALGGGAVDFPAADVFRGEPDADLFTRGAVKGRTPIMGARPFGIIAAAPIAALDFIAWIVVAVGVPLKAGPGLHGEGLAPAVSFLHPGGRPERYHRVARQTGGAGCHDQDLKRGKVPY